jgi:hypothetical protein
MAIEPALQITLVIVLVMATLRLTSSVPYARALCAVIVPLELAVACWLLSLRLERRARAQKRALVELFLALRGDLEQAFSRSVRSAGERVEPQIPLLQLAVRDALEATSERPGRFTRPAVAWVAVVLAFTTVEQWGWQVVVHGRGVDVVAAALVAPCLALFAIACNDLRLGRLRSLADPRRVRRWSQGYSPEQVTTVLPSTPLLLLFVVPVFVLGANWSVTGSLGSHGAVAEAVFGLCCWRGTGEARSRAPPFNAWSRLPSRWTTSFAVA